MLSKVIRSIYLENETNRHPSHGLINLMSLKPLCFQHSKAGNDRVLAILMNLKLRRISNRLFCWLIVVVWKTRMQCRFSLLELDHWFDLIFFSLGNRKAVCGMGPRVVDRSRPVQQWLHGHNSGLFQSGHGQELHAATQRSEPRQIRRCSISGRHFARPQVRHRCRRHHRTVEHRRGLDQVSFQLHCNRFNSNNAFCKPKLTLYRIIVGAEWTGNTIYQKLEQVVSLPVQMVKSVILIPIRILFRLIGISYRSIYGQLEGLTLDPAFWLQEHPWGFVHLHRSIAFSIVSISSFWPCP